MNTDSSMMVIGQDSTFGKDFKVFIHNKTPSISPTISILNNTQNALQTNWSLHNDVSFYGMILNLQKFNSSTQTPAFSIRMPEGNINFSNTGNLQLGLTNNDTSKVNLSIRNNAGKTAFTNSGSVIGLSQEVNSIITKSTLSEVHGLYSYSDSAVFVNNGFMSETGISGQVANIGIFGRVFNTPKYISANSIGIYGQDDVNLPNTYAGYFKGKTKVKGNVTIEGSISKSAGAFKIDHPLDPYNKFLMHSFVESPEMINIYSGITTTGSDSLSVVVLPNYFEALNNNPRYQLSVIGQFSQAIIFETVSNNSFTIKTDKPMVNVSWQVIGTRKDVYATENPIIPETNKTGLEIGNLIYEPQGSVGTLISKPESKNQKQEYKGTVEAND